MLNDSIKVHDQETIIHEWSFYEMIIVYILSRNDEINSITRFEFENTVLFESHPDVRFR